VVAEGGDVARGEGLDVSSQEIAGDFLIGGASGLGTGAIARAAGPLVGRNTVGGLTLARAVATLPGDQASDLVRAYVRATIAIWVLKIFGTVLVENFGENAADGS